MSEWKEAAKKYAQEGKGPREISRSLGVPYSTCWDYLHSVNMEKNTEHKRQKVLLLDVESAPTAAYIWKRWKENIGQDQVISEGYLLTYSAKWLGDDKIACNRIKRQEDDAEIVEELSQLINKADLVIAHNAKRFDLPTIKTRMVYHGLPPLTPFRIVDTLEIAKREFRFPSNSLKSLASYLGLEDKAGHEGFNMWKKCMAMDNEAFEQMLMYNIQDVVVLEQVYNKLSPWDSRSPSVAVLYDDGKHHCPLCGSTNVEKIAKSSYTNTSEFPVYRCGECGKVARSKKNTRSKEDMQSTLMNT